VDPHPSGAAPCRVFRVSDISATPYPRSHPPQADRVANRDALEAAIEAITSQRTTAEWLAVLDGCGMPYAAINDVQDTLTHPHTRARDMVVDVAHDACGPLRLVGPPVKFSQTPPSVRSAPPLLGQHTDEVLTRLAGMTADEISALRAEGVLN
jgi:succinate--hydroxymethylglutarate CoA-transferase